MAVQRRSDRQDRLLGVFLVCLSLFLLFVESLWDVALLPRATPALLARAPSNITAGCPAPPPGCAALGAWALAQVSASGVPDFTPPLVLPPAALALLARAPSNITAGCPAPPPGCAALGAWALAQVSASGAPDFSPPLVLSPAALALLARAPSNITAGCPAPPRRRWR